jgi:hypothetical protein
MSPRSTCDRQQINGKLASQIDERMYHA